MKKAVFAILGVCCLLAAQEASALQAEVRGFTLCTSMSGPHCTAGTFWHPGNVLGKKSSTSCDWTTGTCEVWVPKNVYSFDNARGVNWTCCFELDAGESNGSVTMWVHDHDLDPWAWNDSPDYAAYIGTKEQWGVCVFADSVFKGGHVADEPWDYGSSDDVRVARCTAKAQTAGGWVHKGFEYWIDH
jgi:hypothetical protein